MPQIIPSTGKKLTNTTAAGKAACLAASNLSGQDIDPNVQRPFSIDASEVNDQAALEAISASTQLAQQPIVTSPVVAVIGTAGASQDIVEDSALLVELHAKIDKLLHKQGLCDSDHDDSDEDASDAESDLSVDEDDDDEEEVEQVAVASSSKNRKHKLQTGKNVQVKAHVSKKQKLAEELTQELDQQVSGNTTTVVGQQQTVAGVANSAIASGSVAESITQANAKLDKLLGANEDDETDSETDDEDDNEDNEDDE